MSFVCVFFFVERINNVNVTFDINCCVVNEVVINSMAIWEENMICDVLDDLYKYIPRKIDEKVQTFTKQV